jgi:hypothetical protein
MIYHIENILKYGKYYFRILPHIPRHIWNILWIREDEFHKSLDMHTDLLIHLNKEHTKLYINNLLHRRKISHERDLEFRKKYNGRFMNYLLEKIVENQGDKMGIEKFKTDKKDDGYTNTDVLSVENKKCDSLYDDSENLGFYDKDKLYMKDKTSWDDDTYDEINTEIIDDPEFVYSIDGESFGIYDDIIEDVNNEYEPGEKITLYKGKPKKLKHYDFVRELDIVGILQEMAADEDGDFAEDYFTDVTPEIGRRIVIGISKVLDMYVKQPNYHRVVDVTNEIYTVPGEFYKEKGDVSNER